MPKHTHMFCNVVIVFPFGILLDSKMFTPQIKAKGRGYLYMYV